MTVSILDLHCLSAVMDDHEGVASILEEVRPTSHGNVCLSEVLAALEEMAAAGLLAASSFDPGDSRFVPVDPTGKDVASLWFRITLAGLQELEAN